MSDPTLRELEAASVPSVLAEARWAVESRARSITHAWMAHLGYTPEEITAAEADPDHSACDFTADGWFCLDEDERDRHPVHREMGEVAELVMFTLERSITS